MDAAGVGNTGSVRPIAVSVRAISEAAFMRGAGSLGDVSGPSSLRPAERGEPTPRSRAVGEGRDRSQRSRDGDTAELSRSSANARGADGEPLTDEEQQEVERLRARDQEVRTHEQALVAAAGPLFRGGPEYTLEEGPDGNRYATGGSVSIDTSEGRTPEETVTKAAQIRRAALAPAEPSATDQRIAARASRMEAEARQELAEQRAEDSEDAGAAEGVEPTEGIAATAQADGEEAGDDTAQRESAGSIDPRVSAFTRDTASLESRLVDVLA